MLIILEKKVRKKKDYVTMVRKEVSVMNMDQFIAILTNKITLIALAVLLVLILIWFLLRKSKINHYKKQMQALEIRYNSIKSIPLPFKLNKAVALARVNQDVMTKVTQSKDDFDLAQSNLKQIAQLLADTEDYLLIGKSKLAKTNLLDLEGMIEYGEKQIHDLDALLDSVLEKETAQRTEVTKLKEEFRSLKLLANQKNAQLSFSWDVIEKNISVIEKKFSAFEEWMYASEFQKAEEELLSIAEDMAELNKLINSLPELLQKARGVIPSQIDDVSRIYSLVKQKGVYLQHLDVVKNLELISETLKEDLADLKKGLADKIEEHLNDYQTRLSQLSQQIERESANFDEMNQIEKRLDAMFEEMKTNCVYVNQVYGRVSIRFGFEDLSAEIKEIENKIIQFSDVKVKVDKMYGGKAIPSSTIVISQKELVQDMEGVLAQLSALKARLDSARSDEERAKKQLLKLHLIMNEIQVKIRKHRLPTISNSYEGDLNESYQYIRSIEKLLDETPLNVQLLNATLMDAIDYIYKLYNNVNNIVGMAVMVENTIVFGNKYRSTYSDIDSELTRAELCFRNGEYTQALTIAIAAIEKIHPGSYETLIKANAQSAT